MNKIAIVTGGAGFIGSHCVDLLIKNDYKVRVIDSLIGGSENNLSHINSSNIYFENRDIRGIKPDDKIFKDAELVFHFAGIGDIVPSITHPADYMSVNAQGTVNILECCRHWQHIKKFIYAASSSCYGKASTPTSELNEINPLYPYALSKYNGEQASLHWHRVYNMPVNSIRIFNAYGLRSRTSGAYGAVFGVFLKQKLANKPFTVVGDGTQKRDFLYVTDVVKAFYLAAISKFCGCIWNLGAGNPQSINRLVDLLSGEVTYIPKRPGEPEITHADITKISNDLNWKPNVTFEEGVNIILENIDYWKNAPLWDKNNIKSVTKDWFRYLDGV
jgi:UDP-glucose 4-epimerase